jgi:zinc protease
VNLVETTTDGIYTLFVERDDPQTRAGLVFRVGQADESLAVRGLTHLVQHLALHEVSGGRVHEHGSTGLVHTEFLASGTDEQVAGMLNAVCAALRKPPTHLLPTVRGVVEAEDAATDRSACRSSAVRHGAQAHGLESYPELGLPGIGEADVETWTSLAFTRGNAVLWVTGPRLPRRLDLGLPDGPLVEAAAMPSVLARTPAWYPDPGSGEVELTAVLPRTPAGDLLARLLERAVLRDTVGRERLADDVTVTCAPRDLDHQLLTLLVRGRPEVAPALVGAVVDAIAALRWGAVPEKELREAREDLLDRLQEDGTALGALPRLAAAALLGENLARRPDPAHALAQVGPDDVRRVAGELHRSALVRAPDPGLGWAGYAAVPSGSTWAVDGTELLAVDGSDEVLVLGEEGVTRHSGSGKTSVRYDDVALLQRFADGGRWLTGTDGTEVRVEPRLFDLDSTALTRLDDAVDPAHVVQLPTRGAARVPGASGSALVEPHEAKGAEEPRERRGLSGLFRRRER